MTIDYRQYPGGGGEEPKMTACPYCGDPIKKNAGFVHHWPRCPANPETEADDA